MFVDADKVLKSWFGSGFSWNNLFVVALVYVKLRHCRLQYICFLDFCDNSQRLRGSGFCGRQRIFPYDVKGYVPHGTAKYYYSYPVQFSFVLE